ncbi:Fic family protein [Enterococcus hirae]
MTYHFYDEYSIARNQFYHQQFPSEYLDDILVRFAYHSSAIEGNTISLAQTVSIILHNTVPERTSLRELYEIENHRGAFALMLEKVREKEELSVSLIKEIHERLMDKLVIDHGRFKINENAILGADFETASPQDTPFLMQQLVQNLNFRLELAASEEEQLEAIMDTHIQFERIHPFSDGNGRTGRLLINYSLLKEGFPPLIIQTEEKAEYLEMLAEQNVKGLITYALKRIAKEEKRQKQFIEKEYMQDQERES